MLARLFAVFLVVLAPAAGAEVAKVTGGEHEDFTRLVVEARGAGNWRFGRAADGYALELGDLVTTYDVTDAFQKIPRDRITALWRDPDSGRLRFSLACACHALAFEFRPGIVVIDIRTGPPPAASAFESPLDPPPATADAGAGAGAGAGAETAAKPAPGAKTYDWLAIALAPENADPETDAGILPLPLPTGDVSLDPLRDILLEQISRGVAEGVVEVAEAGPVAQPGANAVDSGPWSRISVGEMPGLKAGTDRTLDDNLTAAGQDCLADTQFAVASWGLAGPVPAQIGLARSGLLTEFDAPVPEAILRAARFHVFLGFGAEARQYLRLLGDTAGAEAQLLDALAQIIDDIPTDNTPFAGMESCDTAAALWATLGRRGLPLSPTTHDDAVARSFSALPLHLRRHLGGRLVDAFMAAGREETARLIRDAILRVPADRDPAVELMDARYHLADGDQKAAQDIAANVMADAAAVSPEAAVTLVEAAFRGRRTIDPNLPLALDAYLQTARGTAQEPGLLRARVLAAAMVTDFATAFALVERVPDSFADLWTMAASQTDDGTFLEQAARYASDRPRTLPETDRDVARRLIGLGFPDLALDWLGPVAASDPEDLRLLAASAHLALRDAAAVLALLAGSESAQAARMISAARLQLGDPRAAADLLLASGDAEAGQRALTWTQDWALVGAAGPEDWRGATDLLAAPETAPAAGPIARGTAIVAESAAARATIEALLQGLNAPVASQ